MTKMKKKGKLQQSLTLQGTKSHDVHLQGKVNLRRTFIKYINMHFLFKINGIYAVETLKEMHRGNR